MYSVLHQLDRLYFVTLLLYSKFFTADHLGGSVFFGKYKYACRSIVAHICDYFL